MPRVDARLLVPFAALEVFAHRMESRLLAGEHHGRHDVVHGLDRVAHSLDEPHADARVVGLGPLAELATPRSGLALHDAIGELVEGDDARATPDASSAPRYTFSRQSTSWPRRTSSRSRHASLSSMIFAEALLGVEMPCATRAARRSCARTTTQAAGRVQIVEVGPPALARHPISGQHTVELPISAEISSAFVRPGLPSVCQSSSARTRSATPETACAARGLPAPGSGSRRRRTRSAPCRSDVSASSVSTARWQHLRRRRSDRRRAACRSGTWRRPSPCRPNSAWIRPARSSAGRASRRLAR
jgi:hypothetical protein